MCTVHKEESHMSWHRSDDPGEAYDDTHDASRRGAVRTYDDEPVRTYEERDTTGAHMALWSPAQIIGLIVGIGFVVLGVAAVLRTGFNTSHIYTPHDLVWRLPHSPLLGVIEIGYGVLMILASVVPGGSRWLMGLLGAIALAFGLVIVVGRTPTRLNHWLAVTHRNGWLFVIVGAVVLFAAILSPVFGGSRSHRHVQMVQTTA
jgi:hypothetical protein